MKLGIVGLPNVGKSTLFNSLTKAGALSANYPFATIDPNVGIVSVPDERIVKLGPLHALAQVAHAGCRHLAQQRLAIARHDQIQREVNLVEHLASVIELTNGHANVRIGRNANAHAQLGAALSDLAAYGPMLSVQSFLRQRLHGW